MTTPSSVSLQAFATRLVALNAAFEAARAAQHRERDTITACEGAARSALKMDACFDLDTLESIDSVLAVLH